MGARIRDSSAEEATTISHSFGEALLFTTMCIIGLPVEVHIKDGSIYSGIFHTANCVENDYGIVLKKARMVKKGNHGANVANWGVIETLVVLPEDLVQVVAKGVMLPADGALSDAACNDVEAVADAVSFVQDLQNEALPVDSHVDKEQPNLKRQVGVGKPQEMGNGHLESDQGNAFKEEPVHPLEGSPASSDGHLAQRNTAEANHSAIVSPQLANGRPTDDGASPSVSGDKNCSTTSSPEVALPQNPVSKRTSKESKLNPGAKIFSPSMNVRPAAPPVMPAVASMAYVPNNFPGIPITASQPEVGIRPIAARSSWPVKFAPHANMPAANGGSGLQYPQPVQITGHIANRAQPLRYGSQYQPIQAGSPYVLPNPQNGMVGRLGQFVYVHPVTHDMVQGATAVSHAPHHLISQQQIHIPKHEGLAMAQPLGLSLTPLMANGQQPYPISNHIQLPQPTFSAIRPITMLGSNSPYGAKFA